MQKLFLFVLLTVSSVSNATVWPVFSVPDGKFFVNHGIVDTSGCPTGYGKIMPQRINIKQSLCKTYCPNEWEWVISKESACVPLNANAKANINIEHFKAADGTISHSRVIAEYLTNDGTSFQAEFISSKNHWYCIYQNEQITCANDI